MKNLMTTSAIVVALGLPAVAFAQTSNPAVTSPMADMTTPMDGFLASRGLTDMLATDLIGEDVYAWSSAADVPAAGTAETDVTATELEAMNKVGQINDIVLSADGRVQAIVIGVGGFIGVGEQDVAVALREVSFASDATNPDDKVIVINMTGDALKSSPPFDRAAMDAATDPVATPTAPETMAEREFLTAPELDRDGYTRVAAGDISVDRLLGKTVYGVDDARLGTVDDVIVDDAGAVKDVIIDFGGFLGMGTTQVALSFDEMTILTNAGNENEDVRIYVDATKEQVRAMPTYNTPVN